MTASRKPSNRLQMHISGIGIEEWKGRFSLPSNSLGGAGDWKAGARATSRFYYGSSRDQPGVRLAAATRAVSGINR